MMLLNQVREYIASRPQEFEHVTDIIALQDDIHIKLARPTFIVYCRSPGASQTRKRRRDFTLLVQNGHLIEYYWLIFLTNHLIMQAAQEQKAVPDPHIFAAVTAKRFHALRMLAEEESDFACTLFLESLIDGVEPYGAVRDFLARTPELAALEDTVLRIAGEFIMFHEVAHELDDIEGLHEELDPFIRTQVQAARPEIRNSLRHELFPDLVALHVVATKYASITREHSLLTFCRIIVAATCIINCWQLTAPELARANTDKSWMEPSLNMLLQSCVRRYVACIEYIDTILFSTSDGIICTKENGIDYTMPLFKGLPDLLVNDRIIVEPLSHASRVAAEILATPLRIHHALPDIIARIERVRTLEKDPKVEEMLHVKLAAQSLKRNMFNGLNQQDKA